MSPCLLLVAVLISPPRPQIATQLRIAILTMVFACSGHAQSSRHIALNSASDIAANFRQVYVDANQRHELGYQDGSIVHHAINIGSTIFLLDSTPEDPKADEFSDVVVEFDFVPAGRHVSIGVLWGGNERTPFNLAVFNIDLEGQDMLRFFTGCDAFNGKLGPQAGPTVNIPSGRWQAGRTYKATLTVCRDTASSADVSFTISDPSGQNPPFAATIDGLPVAAGSANIGFRSSFNNTRKSGNVFGNFIITRLR